MAVGGYSEIHDPNHVLQLQLDYYQTVVRYVHELLNNKDPARTVYRSKVGTNCTSDDDCWTISVTGHSLGGGIANIVASTLGIPVLRLIGRVWWRASGGVGGWCGVCFFE